MSAAVRVVVTGSGAICGAGQTPEAILAALLEGRSALAPITQWDASGWPVSIAAEVADYNAGKLTGDRKLLKHIRRTDVFGLYAADRAITPGSAPGATPWTKPRPRTLPTRPACSSARAAAALPTSTTTCR